jgi:hypothetical protein
MPKIRVNAKALDSAVGRKFAAMNRGLAERPFEFQRAQVGTGRAVDRRLKVVEEQSGVGDFLVRFDAIVIVNQDLLLESSYLDRAPEPSGSFFRSR